MDNTSPTTVSVPDLFEIKKRTASYTFRTPGKYRLEIPAKVEVRVAGQGAQGGGGGAGYSVGGSQGEGDGQIMLGQPGAMGSCFETEWSPGPVALDLEVGEGGSGGRGVFGLDGGKGADGWMRIEIRAINLRTKLRRVFKRVWDKALSWITWTKVGAIVGILSLILGVVALILALS